MSIFESWPTKEQGTWFVAGVKSERKRIVNELEDLLQQWREKYLEAERDDDDEGVTYWHMEIRGLKSIIELIRGEQK
jgi:hypothetical protein